MTKLSEENIGWVATAVVAGIFGVYLSIVAFDNFGVSGMLFIGILLVFLSGRYLWQLFIQPEVNPHAS